MKVADLTVEEFRALLRDVIDEALSAFGDPDAGLDVRPEICERLLASLACPGETVSLETFKDELLKSR